MREKVCIAGSHKATRDLAPWDDLSYDIWAFNEAASQYTTLTADGGRARWVKRWDAVFQLHDPAVYRSPHNRSDKDHWKWLQENHGDAVIYMRELDELVPNSAKLPIDELADLMRDFRQSLDLKQRRYFTSTPAISIAMAVLLGYREIMLCGFEMSSETEYHYQRDCVTFWIGFALGRGVKVNMLSGDDIFERPVYGYEGYYEAAPEHYTGRIAELKPLVEEKRATIRQLEDHLEQGWTNGANDTISKLAEERGKLAYLEGQIYENERYLFKVEQMLRDEGFGFIDRNEYEVASANAQKELVKLGPDVYRSIGHVDLTLETFQFTRNPAYMPQLRRYVQEHMDAVQAFGRTQGIFDENRRLAIEMDKYLKAAGGIKTVQSVLGMHA